MTSLAADRLVAVRGGRNVVDGVSLEVHDGLVLGLVGPSGSGKSTTLLLLAGLEPPDAGIVRLDGQDLAELGTAGRQALRRDRVALVFQGYGLLRDAADRVAAAVGATHDPEVVELCDRVVRLVDGRPLELTPGEVGEPVA